MIHNLRLKVQKRKELGMRIGLPEGFIGEGILNGKNVFPVVDDKLKRQKIRSSSKSSIETLTEGGDLSLLLCVIERETG